MRNWIWLGLGLLACNGKDDEETTYTIEDQPLSGKINGVDWTFESGITDDFLSDEEEFFVALFGEVVDDACNFGFSDGSEILVGVPTEVGEYNVSLSQSGTFVYDDGDTPMNLVATDGLIRVDEITDTELTGGLALEVDEDNTVNGTFTVTICPTEDF